MTAIAGERLTGARKAAVLCLTLGTEASARILRQLSPEEVERVSEEIARLPAVPPGLRDQVLTEYRSALQEPAQATGGVHTARALLEATLGAERARGAVERMAAAVPETGLSRLGRATPETLIQALRGEQPQTIAVVLAHVEPRLAAGVLGALPPELATDVAYRVARLGPVAPDVLAELEVALAARVDLALSGPKGASGGPATLARVLALVPGAAGSSLLEALSARGQELAAEVRDLMFVFEDLQLLEDRAMQRLLREVASRDLALALKAASEPLRQKVFKNMSERAVEALREEMEMLGPVKVKDVQAAHGSIIATARSLQEAGEISLDRGDGEDTIA